MLSGIKEMEHWLKIGIRSRSGHAEVENTHSQENNDTEV